ncbi:MAG TPA: hypothetical protein VHT91_43935 [Kofleriaceae bacterium]|nr:hypothetical protein [Kofleriaceae bacterium]
MARTHRYRELLAIGALSLGGCGWLPPDTPPARPSPPDPDAAVLHDWKVAGHVLGTRALISDADGAGFHDRRVSVTPTAYASPWSGRCDQARRGRQSRALAEIATAHDIAADRATGLGLAGPIIEYQLQCATNRTPALIVYVAGSHALTCWSGVCYLLAR